MPPRFPIRVAPPAADHGLVDVLSALAVLDDRTTELVSTTRGLIVNDVIRAGSVQLDSNGLAAFTFPASKASVFVAHLGTGTLTVANTVSAGQGNAPGFGVGILPVPSGGWVCSPLAGGALSLYGQPGETAIVIVLDRLVPPAAGQIRPELARPVPIGAGQLTLGAGTYNGFSLAAAGAGTVTLFDGTSAAGTVLEALTFSAAGSLGDFYPGGVKVATGIFAVLTGGGFTGSVRVG